MDSEEQVRRRLVAERDDVRERLETLDADFLGVVDASRDTNADDEHDPEGSTIAFERSQLGALVVAAREQLSEVDAALDRLDAGTYGRCERCGEQVAAARLQARPAARSCVGCAARRTG